LDLPVNTRGGISVGVCQKRTARTASYRSYIDYRWLHAMPDFNTQQSFVGLVGNQEANNGSHLAAMERDGSLNAA